MQCERCSSKEAIIKLVRIEKGGQVNSQWVCPDCAAELSPYQAKLLQKPTLASILKELSQQDASQSGAVVEADTCPSCGLDFRAYKSTAMLGCPDCYDAFSDEIERDLQKLHRATRHVEPGGAPVVAPVVEAQRRLRLVREELADAIEMEDYERAAFLRDEQRKLEEAIRGTPPAEAPEPDDELDARSGE